MLSQTCINLFHVLNTKEDILKNVGNQTVAGPLDCRIKKNTMEVTVDQQLFNFYSLMLKQQNTKRKK